MVVLLLPVPWLHVVSDDPPGHAWRLDGRLEVDGRSTDPPGRWTWLTVGRPQLVGEVIRDHLTGDTRHATDLRHGPAHRRPSLNEPAAVAVGLRHAGLQVPLGVRVEVRGPLLEGYHQAGVVTAVDGAPLTDQRIWDRVSSAWEVDRRGHRPGSGDPAEQLTFRFRDGQRFSAPGPGLPYDQVTVRPTPPEGLTAGVTFGLARFLPVDWFRNLSLGGSHGMMVALLAYADASGRDLAQGRHIAGTGGILGDGTVTRIGGLRAKAKAAQRTGANVLLVPETQADELEDLALGSLTVVPVGELQDAIDWLAVPVT